MTILHKPSSPQIPPTLPLDGGEADAPEGLPLAILAVLPHSEPDECALHRSLCQGSLRLNIQAPRDVGLPYGRIPRLLFAHLWAEAIRSAQPEILLARSWTGLSTLLEIAPFGPPEGSIQPIQGCRSARRHSSRLQLRPDWKAEANHDGLVVFPFRKAATRGKRPTSDEKAWCLVVHRESLTSIIVGSKQARLMIPVVYTRPFF